MVSAELDCVHGTMFCKSDSKCVSGILIFPRQPGERAHSGNVLLCSRCIIVCGVRNARAVCVACSLETKKTDHASERKARCGGEMLLS